MFVEQPIAQSYYIKKVKNQTVIQTVIILSLIHIQMCIRDRLSSALFRSSSSQFALYLYTSSFSDSTFCSFRSVSFLILFSLANLLFFLRILLRSSQFCVSLLSVFTFHSHTTLPGDPKEIHNLSRVSSLPSFFNVYAITPHSA